VTLTNHFPRDVFFKVKTTAPKKVCVKPASGIVPAEGTMEVVITLASRTNLQEDRNIKLLVQAVWTDLKADFEAPDSAVASEKIFQMKNPSEFSDGNDSD
jgi:hypothetical protein